MSKTSPTLHLLCGKIASGKSTLAAELSTPVGTVAIAEDDWLSALYSDEITTVSDYVRCSAKLRKIMGPHVAAVLRAGLSVVLDFPANTLANRAWMRDIIQTSGAAHKLHYLDVPDEICKARLRQRNAQGEHEFSATDAQFDLITQHFAVPQVQEGFDIVLHRFDDGA